MTNNILPRYCYATLPSTGQLIKIDRYESGYTPIDSSMSAEEANELIGVNKAQAEAMFMGSMFGWDTPAANPSNYDSNGRPL